MNKLIFIVTMHNAKENEINKWVNAKNKLDSLNIKVFFLIDEDNSNNNLKYSKLWNQFYNKKNIGKLKTVINFVDNNKSLLKDKYIKIFDPDDYIDLCELKKLIDKLKNYSEINLIFNTSRNKLIDSRNKLFIENNSNPYLYGHVSNFNSIIWANSLMNHNLELPSISKNSDSALAFISNIDFNYEYIDNSFYIYDDRNGISSIDNQNIKQRLNLLKQAIEYLKFIDFNNSLINKEEVYSTTPGHGTFYWCHSILKTIDLTRKEKRKIILEVFDLIKRNSIKNKFRKRNSWNLIKKMYYLILQ